MRILIAEDDPMSRLILEKAVTGIGHTCVVAVDGEDAWSRYQHEHATLDVIISDWMMPGLDGVDLCRRVRAARHTAYAYFILFTALTDREHVHAGLEAGADDYLTKPFDRDDLRVRLLAASRVTSLYRLLDEQNAELERLNRKLFHQARRDPLTRLRNQLQMREDLESLRARAARDGQTYYVALCDVDHFKSYNDTYGHAAGDEVLCQVAAAMEQNCRDGDTAYRYGGEEFLLLLAAATPEGAFSAVERLRQAVEELGITHAGNRPSGVVTLSGGVTAFASSSCHPVERALHGADSALYRAKAAGRNRVVSAEPSALPSFLTVPSRERQPTL